MHTSMDTVFIHMWKLVDPRSLRAHNISFMGMFGVASSEQFFVKKNIDSWIILVVTRIWILWNLLAEEDEGVYRG